MDWHTLRGHQNNLLVQRDVSFVAEETRNHKLRAVADGVYSTVLDDDPLVAHQKRFKRADDATQVGLWSNET